MTYRILTLSPGSTSTKVAVFEGEKALMRENVRHDPAVLAGFDRAADQLEFRTATVLDALAAAGIALESIDAFSGYCGGMGPTKGGIFRIDEKVCEHVLGCGMNHPAILGAPILFDLASRCGKPAFAVNQPDTDELADVARITGYPGVYRKSHVHCLNQKECAIRCAASLGKRYDEVNVIVAHVGGGLSVAAHRQGRMVDTNDVLEGSGPFAPNRSGDVPAKPIATLAFSGTHDKKEVMGVIGKTGGLKGLLGTDDAQEIDARIDAGEHKSADTATSYRATTRSLVALLAAALLILPFRVSPSELAAGAIGARPTSGGSTIDADTDDSTEETSGDSDNSANGGANPTTGSGSQNAGAGQASSSAKLELTTETFYSQVEEMIANGRAHDGQRVELTGFVLSAEAASAQASIPRVTDEESFAVARMAIWCCAADAYPVGFAVRWGGAVPAADSWVRVRGTLRLRGAKALVIDAESVEVTSAPDPEFVIQKR